LSSAVYFTKIEVSTAFLLRENRWHCTDWVQRLTQLSYREGRSKSAQHETILCTTKTDEKVTLRCECSGVDSTQQMERLFSRNAKSHLC